MNASATPGVRMITDWLRSEEGYKKLQNAGETLPLRVKI
jgi:hypothetical protein